MVSGISKNREIEIMLSCQLFTVYHTKKWLYFSRNTFQKTFQGTVKFSEIRDNSFSADDIQY